MVIVESVQVAFRWEVVTHADGVHIRETIDNKSARDFGPLPDDAKPEALIAERLHMASMLPSAWRKLGCRPVKARRPARAV